MAFKGIFDGSVEIGQAREGRAHEAALQQQRIAAQMAMQTQQLRAQAQAQRAQLQASMQQANADMALKQQEVGLKQQEIGLKQQEFDSGAALREMGQENAKLMLQQAQADFDEDQARRATLTQFRQSAFGAGLITAALNGVAPTTTLSRMNQANGVADGDLGSIVGMGGGPEGLWYDVIAADEQGGMGKKRQEVDPMTLLAVAHSLYGEKGASDFIQMYKSRDTNNTRMNIAFDKYLQSLEVQKLKNQGAKEVADIKSDTTLAVEDKKTDRATTVQELKNEGATTVQGMKTDTTLAVEDKKTDRATKVQELKNQVGGVLGISPAKVNLPSAVKTLTEQLEDLNVELNPESKRNKGKPLDPVKVKRRDDVQKALDNVLGMLAQGYTQKRWIGPNTNADGEAGGGTVATVRVMGTDGNLYEQNSDGEFYKVEKDPALPSPPAAAQDETDATQAATNAPPAVEAPAAAQDETDATQAATNAPPAVEAPAAAQDETDATQAATNAPPAAETSAAAVTDTKGKTTAETADVDPIAKKNGWKFPTKHPMVKNEKGSKSNVMLRTTTRKEDDGDWTYVYPTMVDGKQLTDKEAMKVADSHNWKGYPRFKTVKYAKAYAEANHGNIAADGTIMAKASASKSASKKEPEGKAKPKRDRIKHPELGVVDVERGDDGQWYIVPSN